VDEGPALSLTYDYDFDGQVHHKHDRLVKRRDTFSYDALHRLDGWTLSSVIPGPPGFPEATPTLHETAYVYDPLGNLSTVVRDGALQESNLYGQNGKPHALTHDLQGAYLYDARGRQEHTSKREVTFTEHDLPRTIDTAAGQTRFSYDAAGRRVKKAGPAESLITLAGLYERHVSAGTVRHVFIIEGGEGPVAERSYEEVSGAGSTEYLHRDPLGSVGAVSDQAGALLHARYYEPFGARRDKDGDPAAAPPGDPRLGFAGHVHDEDLGLIDMRGRIYDPALRRFLTPDPHVTDPLSGQSYNRYSYVVNNPINLTDPSGFDFASSSSGGCGFEASCTGSFGTDVGFSFSFGGPGGETGGGSAPDQSSGLNIASSKPKSTIRLPAGTGVSSGARSGPQAQAWSQPSSSDFYNQLRLDLAESIAYNNALWDANTQTRMRRALSTQAQDEDAWRRSGTGGAPSIGYAHDALVYSLNAGHGIGVEQVANAAAVVGMAGAAWKAGQAGFGLLRGLASAQAGADGAAAGVSLNSSNLAMGVERATPELLSAVQRHGRTIQIVAEGSEELRYLNYIGAEANVGGETMAHILLRPDPSKAAVLEEFLHGTQFRLGIVQRLGVQGAETHVKSFMIRHRGMLGLGEADVAALRQLMEAGL
jgi:RHS repeat-associated protein